MTQSWAESGMGVDPALGKGKEKIPYRLYLPDDALFAFVGIWDTWHWQDRTTYAIITTEPNALVKTIHDRMPVILPREYESSWLKDGDVSLLKPFAAAGMRTYTISTLVNSPQNNAEAVLNPLTKKHQTISHTSPFDSPKT